MTILEWVKDAGLDLFTPKTVRVYGMLAGRGVPAPLNPEEVRAIYQQMVELGWLEDQNE